MPEARSLSRLDFSTCWARFFCSLVSTRFGLSEGAVHFCLRLRLFFETPASESMGKQSDTGVESIWPFASAVALLFVLYASVWSSLYRRLSLRPWWAFSNPLSMIFFQFNVALLAGLTAFLVWVYAEDAEDQNGFYALWFASIGVLALAQWVTFGHCYFGAKWLILVAALAWIGVLVWGIVLAWFTVFSSVAVLFAMVYYLVLAFEFHSKYRNSVPPNRRSGPTVVVATSVEQPQQPQPPRKTVYAGQEPPPVRKQQQPQAAPQSSYMYQRVTAAVNDVLNSVPMPDSAGKAYLGSGAGTAMNDAELRITLDDD